MARDETGRERDPLLDRRSYLRLAGTAAAVAVAGASGSADAADHDTTSVPAGERRDHETGDGADDSVAAPPSAPSR